MLIYEKKVDGVRHLYGTEGNIPSVSDQQLAYKDNTGATVDVSDMTYFYNKDNAIFGNSSTNQIPAADDKKVNVWLGDDLIIGNIDEVTVTVNEVENVEITLSNVTSGKAAKGATVGLSIEAADGYTLSDVSATVNGTAITLTETGGVYTPKDDIIANENIAIVVTATAA